MVGKAKADEFIEEVFFKTFSFVTYFMFKLGYYKENENKLDVYELYQVQIIKILNKFQLIDL